VTKKLDVDPVAGRFEMEVVWHGSAEAEEHVAVLGRTAHPSCWMLAGYASGFMSFALGHDVYFVEQSCRVMANACARLWAKTAPRGVPSSTLTCPIFRPLTSRERSIA